MCEASFNSNHHFPEKNPPIVLSKYSERFLEKLDLSNFSKVNLKISSSVIQFFLAFIRDKDQSQANIYCNMKFHKNHFMIFLTTILKGFFLKVMVGIVLSTFAVFFSSKIIPLIWDLRTIILEFHNFVYSNLVPNQG